MCVEPTVCGVLPRDQEVLKGRGLGRRKPPAKMGERLLVVLGRAVRADSRGDMVEVTKEGVLLNINVPKIRPCWDSGTRLTLKGRVWPELPFSVARIETLGRVK